MNQIKKARRVFSPEQKAAMVNQIETEIKSGVMATQAVEKYGLSFSVYTRWKKQLAVGIKSSLRNGKPPVDKEKKKMQQEIERLKAIVVSQAQAIADLKKETNWD